MLFFFLLDIFPRDAAIFCVRRDGLETGEFEGSGVACMLTGCGKLGWGFGVGVLRVSEGCDGERNYIKTKTIHKMRG